MRVKYLLQESLHFGTALERDWKRASVANLVREHRIGTFPTTMPRNIFFACAQKILALGSRHFGTLQERDWKCAGVANSVPDHRIRAFPTKIPRNICFACSRKIHSRGAGISEPPQNATENAPVLQIRFSIIELEHSPPQCRENMCAKNSLQGSRHIGTAPERDRKCVGVANAVATIELGHSPPKCQEILFSHAREKSAPR